MTKACLSTRTRCLDMALLVLGTVLALGSPSAQAAAKPIATLPPHWRGECHIYTPEVLLQIQASLGGAPTEYECSIALDEHLLIIVKTPHAQPHRIISVNVSAKWGYAYAPISLRLNDGATYALPPELRNSHNVSEGTRGWGGAVAQEIITRMQTASTVSLRYTTAPMAAGFQFMPAGLQEVTLSLKTFPQAWQALQTAVRQLPPLR